MKIRLDDSPIITETTMEDKDEPQQSRSINRRKLLLSSGLIASSGLGFTHNATAYRTDTTIDPNQFKWTHDFGHPYVTGVSLDESKIYVGVGNEITVVDSKTGSVIKSLVTGRGDIITAPELTDRGIIVTNTDSISYLEKDSLSTRWDFSPEQSPDSVKVIGDRVILLQKRSIKKDEPARIIGVDLSTGDQEWTYQLTGGVSGSAKTAEQDIVVAGRDGSIFRLSKDGDVKWKSQTRNPINTVPLIKDDSVYIQDTERPHREVSSQIYRVDISDGTIIHKHETGPPSRNTSPVSTQAGVVTVTRDGYHLVSDIGLKFEERMKTESPLVTVHSSGLQMIGITEAGKLMMGSSDLSSVEKEIELPTRCVTVDKKSGVYSGSAGQIKVDESNVYVMASGGVLAAVQLGGGL